MMTGRAREPDPTPKPEVVTSTQMRALEQEAIRSGKVSGLTLMERAGRGVVEAIFEEWPELARALSLENEYLQKDESRKAPRVIVLCGPGNNGGDGFVIARLLARQGWDVAVFFLGAAERLPPDARTNHDRWARLGDVKPLTVRAIKDAPEADILVDALFGIGLSRRPTGVLADVLCHLAGAGTDRAFIQPKIVAVDVPSGLDADTGTLPDAGTKEGIAPCPFCAMTVTFHQPKPGHVTGVGQRHCGKLIVKDIGL